MTQNTFFTVSRRQKAAAVLGAALCAVFLVGCATTVSVDVTRPAELDIERNTAVASIPFKTSSELGYPYSPSTPFWTFSMIFSGTTRQEQSEEYEIVAALDRLIGRNLRDSRFISFVDTSTVEDAWRNRKKLSVIDVYITGGITYYESRLEKDIREETFVDKKTKEKRKRKVVYYRRRGSIDVTYQIIDANNDAVLTYMDFSDDFSSSWNKNPNHVTDSIVLIRDMLEEVADSIVCKLEPHEVTVDLTLLKHRSDAMKEADKLAKKGQLAAAESRFYAIYRNNGLFEAGYNAALLLQAMERYDEARALMSDVYRESGDKRAKEALKKIEAEIWDRERLEQQLGR